MSHSLSAKDRLFVALDVASVDRARMLVSALGDSVSCYKVGLELLFGGGLEFAQGLKAAGKTVFLDMKLLDIANTVEKAAANIAGLGLDYLTIHGVDSKTVDAAVRGRAGSTMKLLAVTVLTSLERADVEQQGIRDMAPADLVVHRARLSKAGGIDGIVASAQEAALIRAEVGPDVLIVTPGIRLSGGAVGDQARVMTPGKAIAAGADMLVVGRPITEAPDPRVAAASFIAEIEEALK